MVVHPKLSWYSRSKRDWKRRKTDISHTMIIGNSTTSKNYTMMAWLEEIIKEKLGKLWYLWITDWQHLEEALTFLIPNKKGNYEQSRFKPHKEAPQFAVRVYVPVSQDAPNY